MKDQRKYTKVETFYAGSMLFTNLDGLGLIAEGLALKGYELINLIIKANVLRNQAKDTLGKYIESFGHKNEEIISNVKEMIKCLTSEAVMSIEKFQNICVTYNEILKHEENFEDDEEEIVHKKVDDILFNRFLHDNWTALENESYNNPTKKLDMEFNIHNAEECFESYISEFMSEISFHLSKNEDRKIIKVDSATDNDDTFRELNIDYYQADSYREMKKSLINIKEAQKLCYDNLITENASELLKEKRTGLNMTLQNVSEITGLTPGYISRVENGSSTLSIESLYKLCTAYNVDIGDFLTNKNLTPLSDSKTQYLDEILLKSKIKLNEDTINPSDKEYILKFSNLLVKSKTKESKEAIKNILNSLILLKE